MSPNFDECSSKWSKKTCFLDVETSFFNETCTTRDEVCLIGGEKLEDPWSARPKPGAGGVDPEERLQLRPIEYRRVLTGPPAAWLDPCGHMLDTFCESVWFGKF